MDVESTMLPLGTKLPEFNLKGIDEKYYKNSDFSENDGLLVMFICNHCPFVKHINEGLVDFTNDLIAKNIGCLLYTSPSPRDRQKSRMPSSA